MSSAEGTAPAESSLPWLWVIEYLASFKRVNLKLLYGIIQSAPGLHDELEKNVRELVTLRCLEQLSVSANANEAICDVASTSDSGPDFESSQSCEDVLGGILQEGSISDFIARGREPLKSQVRRFIMQKRISTHQPSIRQLKDAILKGTHRAAAALKLLGELTSLTDRDNLGHSDIPLGEPDGRGDNDPNMGANGNPNSAEHDREEPQLERKSRKRNSTLPNSENLTQNSQENQHIDDGFAVHSPTAKKLKQSVPGATQSKKAASLLVNESDSERDTNAEQEKFDFAQYQMEASDEDVVVEETPEIRNERRGVNGRLPAQSQVGGPVKESTARGNLGTILDAMDAPSAGEFQQREFIVEDAVEVDQQHTEELSSDSDGYLHEDIDVSARDSLENLVCIEQNVCMKCKEGGQLLVCHTNRCPLAVHKNCVDSPTSFDENGNFVCPFCQYSNAISEYFEAKKEAASAREDLHASITTIFKQQPQNLNGTWLDDSQNQIDELSEVPEGPYNPRGDGDKEQAGPSLNGDLGNGVSNQLQKDEGSEGRAETSEQNSDLNSSPPVVEEEQVSGGAATVVGSEENEKNNILQSNVPSRDKEKQVNGKVRERQSGDRLEGLNGDVMAEDQGTGGNLAASKTGPLDGTSVNVGDQREALPSDTNEPLRKPGCALHVDGEDNSEDDIEDADADKEHIISNYTISPRRQKNMRVSTSPAVARLRRKKPPWTEEEVKILKEGVEKYRDADTKIIPWKKVLEFGASVFKPDRNAQDLKNKWRATAGAQN